MTFETLEQRYKDKVSDLYSKTYMDQSISATSKFEGGKPSSGFNDDPLNVRRIGDESFGRISQTLGRFLPIQRTLQDVIRLTKFTASIRGITFLVKQQLLQTGNTFEQTRLINPLFVLMASATPAVGNFIRMRRHLRPRDGYFSRTDTSTNNVRKLGQLQQETYDKLTGKQQSLLGPFKSLFTSKKNVGWGESEHSFTGTNWTTSRPELFSPKSDAANASRILGSRWTRFVNRDNINDSIQVGKINTEVFPITTSEPVTQSTSLKNLVEHYLFFTSDFIRPVTPKKQNIYGLETIGDSSNKRRLDKNTPDAKINFPYDSINNNFTDYINVSFAMGRSDDVRFRAYLKDLQQSINPQYKEFQYVGRTDKFITYTGAQREVSFKLGVIAETPEELKEVWKRINYLTGLVFPFGITAGVYQPNIVRLTLGKVFIDQPSYITSFNTNFSEIIESWDIDQQVPMGAQIDMRCVLIEKFQRVANSPFYGIMEQYIDEEWRQRKLAGIKDPTTAAPGIEPPKIPVAAPQVNASVPVTNGSVETYNEDLEWYIYRQLRNPSPNLETIRPPEPEPDPFGAGEGVQQFDANGNPKPYQEEGAPVPINSQGTKSTTKSEPPKTNGTHTVVRGDTLGKIAGMYKVSLRTLIQANPQIRNPDLIRVGQIIKIPDLR